MDAQALRDSFAWASRAGEEMTRYFYSCLFLMAPELRPMFPVSMDMQRDRLLTALGRIVSQVDQWDQLGPYLEQLARDHRKFDVIAQHYEPVGRSLLATLAFFLGDAWTAELEATWTAAYSVVAQTMVAAAEADEKHNPPWWHAEVIKHELRLFDLAVVTLRPTQPLAYLPGQSVMVELPSLPSTWRPYTPANAPRPDGTIELHIRAVDGGLVSPALVYGLQLGDVLRLGAPMGALLTLDGARDRDLVLVAGGTGLAPLRAVVEQLVQQHDRRRVDLFVAGRDPADLYDMPTLSSLAQASATLHVHPLVGPDAGDLDNRSVAAGVLRSTWWQERAFYVCGSPRMVDATVRDLRAHGVHQDLLRYEDAR